MGDTNKKSAKSDTYDIYRFKISKKTQTKRNESSLKPKVSKQEKRDFEIGEEREDERNLTDYEKEQLVIEIKEVSIARDTPLGREKIMSRENIEIPLVKIVDTQKPKFGEKETSLRNVRKYVNLDFKRELMETEQKSKKVITKRGILSKLLGFKGKQIVLRSDESKQLVLNHLRSTKPYPETIGTIAVAFYLKEFLQVIFGIEEELTYDKLASIIETKNIETSLKNELREFFTAISKQIYERKVVLEYKKVYELAEKTVEQLLGR